jgi:hypothetical protein
MDAGLRKDRGEAVQELQGRETQGGAAGEIGLGEQVENLVRAAADQVESISQPDIPECAGRGSWDRPPSTLR